MRIHKLLSQLGIASLRASEELVRSGKVTVNGRRAVIGQDVRPGRDVIHVGGERIEVPKKAKKLYLALHKPRGYVTTLSDELGRRCVASLVEDVGQRVFPVGRLDRDSEGLLLMTNDGEFANFIMHPSHHISKTYRVTVRSGVTEDQIVRLSAGVTLDDGAQTQPAQVQVEVNGPERTVLRITIYEGKNRQIRRMCEAVGLEVARLRRTSIGAVKLGMLAPGKWRELTPQEIGAIRNAVSVRETPAGAKKPVRRSGGMGGAKPAASRPPRRAAGRAPKKDGRA